jgi:peptidoglycan/LPS O-acetylase OafA/YrhL
MTQPNSLPAPKQSAHLPGVDVLRACACLWVVLFHVGLWWNGGQWRGFGPLQAEASSLGSWLVVWASRLGFHGVGMFLTLSGFCLYYPLALRGGVKGARVGGWGYVTRRAGRILPAYYASIAALVVLASYPPTSAVVLQPITTRDVVTHLALVHNLFADTLWSINGVYWSLGLEAQLYVVFPLLVLLARKRGIGAVAALGLASSLAWFGVLRWAKQSGLRQDEYCVLLESLPARLNDFTLGMLAAGFLAEGRPVSKRLLVLLALLWIPASHLVQVTDGFHYPFDRPINALSWASLVLLVGRMPTRAWAGPIARSLAWVGTISYSLYLAHQPLLLLLRPHATSLGLSPWQLSVAGTVASVAGGAVFYALVEGPAQRWLTRLRRT